MTNVVTDWLHWSRASQKETKTSFNAGSVGSIIFFLYYLGLVGIFGGELENPLIEIAYTDLYSHFYLYIVKCTTLQLTLQNLNPSNKKIMKAGKHLKC